MLTTLVTADPEPSLEQPPGRPWAVRRAAGPQRRPALEIYAAHLLVDVLVLPSNWPLSPRIIRGACSVTWAGQRFAAAWGVLPPAGRDLLVEFSRGRIHTQACPAEPVTVGAVFWFAHTAGHFRHVVVTQRGGQERHDIRPARPC
jgi:hypothetical protein